MTLATSKNKKYKKLDVHRMTFLAIFASIILVMSFTPLGYLNLGAIQITFIMIPVAVGAIMTDPMGGLFLGTMFGISSLMVGFLNGWLLPIIELNPVLNTILVIIWLIVPRSIMGFLVSVIFRLVSKIDKTKIVSYLVASVSGALLNTLLYTLFLIGMFGANSGVLQTLGADSIVAVVVGVISFNAVLEAVVSLIVGGGISKALAIYLPGGKRRKTKITAETPDTVIPNEASEEEV